MVRYASENWSYVPNPHCFPAFCSYIVVSVTDASKCFDTTYLISLYVNNKLPHHTIAVCTQHKGKYIYHPE